jgi:hypothetical protein
LLSGLFALSTTDDFPGLLIGFLKAALTVRSIGLPVVLAAHLVLAFLFIAYLPFTQMLHFVAKYFTYHLVRWDDGRMVPGSQMEKQVLQLLKQPVTWSAAHLQANGNKNWIDIVSEKDKK